MIRLSVQSCHAGQCTFDSTSHPRERERDRLSAKLISCVQYNLVAINRTVRFSHFEAASSNKASKEQILETTVIIEILC